MTMKHLKNILKALKLPLSRNRQDVRLLNNRILPPFTPKSWAGDTIK